MIRFLQGDCREVLKTLPDASVQCVVTSPPYFGLRDYGTATWVGGNPECDHVVGAIRTGLGLERLGERYAGSGHKAAEPKPLTAKHICPHCGAVRTDSQIGLEASPAEFISEMVAVFREVRRVLRDDGVVWLNLGDSYSLGVGMARGQQYQRHAPQKSGMWKGTRSEKRDLGNNGVVHDGTGAKPKDLLMIPARVAIALQADGWFLRSDIIWHKPNPMPESVTDRPTSSHEHVFLLTKKSSYFYDAESVREHIAPSQLGRERSDVIGGKSWNERNQHSEGGTYDTRKLRPSLPKGSFGGKTADQAQPAFRADYGSRNLRNVWTIATAPFVDAHFATFPPELAERCIKAGSRPGDTILDPFAGAFTTALVADRLQRDAIGIELNADYVAMARRRIEADAGMFAQIAAE
jgi:DNA modification methylase